MGPTVSTEKLHEVSEENVARIRSRRRRSPICTFTSARDRTVQEDPTN
jgi:hypothetical protein